MTNISSESTPKDVTQNSSKQKPIKASKKIIDHDDVEFIPGIKG